MPKQPRVYWVKPKKRKPARVEPFMVYDVETWGAGAGQLAGTFCLACVYWRKGKQDILKTFHSRDELVDYLLAKNTPKRAFAWNLKFDGFHVLAKLNDEAQLATTVLRVKRSKEGGKPAFTEIPRATLAKHDGRWLLLVINQDIGKKERLKLMDACNYFGVGALGSAIVDHELPYTKIPIQWENIFPGSPDLDTLEAHCVNDVKATYDLVNWYEDYWVSRGVKPGLTRHSTSIELLKSCCLDPGDVLPPSPMVFREMIRKGLRGGRCEVFKQYHKGEFYSYDINSLYPSMYRKLLPLSGAGLNTDMKPEEVATLDKFAFIDCVVSIPAQEFGPLPYVTRSGALIFPAPCNRLEFTWTSVELQQAIRDFGVVVIKVNKAIVFSRSEEFLRKFADDTEKLKADVRNRGEYQTIKHIRNGLWGKFAEKSEREHVHFEPIPEDMPIENVREMHEGDGKTEIPYWVSVTDQAKGHHLPHIAAAITAYGRMRILHDIALVRKMGYKVCYCDTDSMILDRPLPDSWIGTGDGLYKLEFIGHTEFIALAPKVYSMDGKSKAKGFPKPPKHKAYKEALAGDYSNFRVEWLQQCMDYRSGAIKLLPASRQLHARDTKRIHLSLTESIPIAIQTALSLCPKDATDVD